MESQSELDVPSYRPAGLPRTTPHPQPDLGQSSSLQLTTHPGNFQGVFGSLAALTAFPVPGSPAPRPRGAEPVSAAAPPWPGDQFRAGGDQRSPSRGRRRSRSRVPGCRPGIGTGTLGSHERSLHSQAGDDARCGTRGNRLRPESSACGHTRGPASRPKRNRAGPSSSPGPPPASPALPAAVPVRSAHLGL